jgi:3-hydroxybutyryl-CoA dehydrogenase
MDKPRITVIGAGLMGHAIAWLLAAAGHEVRVQDPDPKALEALPGRLADISDFLGRGDEVAKRVTGTDDMRRAVGKADIVFEAAPEDIALKQDLFRQFDVLAPATAILCSNTSVIPIGEISAGVADKSRVLGTHFWNPRTWCHWSRSFSWGLKIARRARPWRRCCAKPAATRFSSTAISQDLSATGSSTP